METVLHIQDIPKHTQGTAVTIGNFDGLHKGHKKLISTLAKEAQERGLLSVVYTFRKHPLSVLKGKGTITLLTDLREKTEQIKALGADILYLSDFVAVQELSPRVFAEEILVQKLGVRLVIIGENNRFGKHSEGDSRLMQKLGEEYGFEVFVIPTVEVNGLACSSSTIRTLLKKGEVRVAKELLGRAYTVSGEVISGKRLGRTIGFPTANMVAPPDKVLPAYGVYATEVTVEDKRYKAITNVGETSFDKKRIERIETHLLDFGGDLYGKQITVHFLSKLRNFIPFRSVEELEKQLMEDREARRNMKEDK